MICLISEGLTREAGQEMLNGLFSPTDVKEKLRKLRGFSFFISTILQAILLLSHYRSIF